MIALAARIAMRAACRAASIPCTACVSGGQAAVSCLSGLARLMWSPLARASHLGYLLYLRLSRR
eukprot:5235951-Prymnesium_polylepis.1